MLKSAIGAVHSKAVLGRRKSVLSTAIQDLIPQGASVLDVGTGDGQIAHLCQMARPDIQIEGIDVFVRDNTHVPVRAFDGRRIPYEDDSVDVVTCIDVLHHADDALALLREFARVARSRVVIKDHISQNALDRWTLRLMDWVGNAPHGVALPYNYLSRAAWREHFLRAGLRLVSLERHLPLYPPPFSVIFGRDLHFVASLEPAAGPRAQKSSAPAGMTSHVTTTTPGLVPPRTSSTEATALTFR